MNGREEIFHRNTMLAAETTVDPKDSRASRVARALIWNHWTLFVIGPCAAQSHEQLEEIITEIESCKLDHLTIAIRVCHDKPRSHAVTVDGGAAWEGIGLTRIVPILKRIKREHPETLIFTEIRDPDDLQVIGKFLDAIWIGSREGFETIRLVTEAAAKHRLPVFIKNGPLDGKIGITNMMQRLEQGIRAAAKVDNDGKIVKLETFVVPFLRGTPPQEPIDGVRNISNFKWILELQKVFPGILSGGDIGHLALSKGVDDPAALHITHTALKQALGLKLNLIMAEVTGSVLSRTDPGVPIHALLDLLANLTTRQSKGQHQS